MAEKILSISEKLDQETGGTVFSKFGELIDLAEQENLTLAESFYGKGGRHLPEMKRVKLELLKKAHHQIASFGQKLTRTEGSQQQIQNLIDELQNDKAEISLLASVLKITKEKGGIIDLEEIKDLNIEKKYIDAEADFSEKEKSELLTQFNKTYSEIFANNPQALKRVIEGLKNEFNHMAGQTAYTLKYKNQIVAFCRFKPLNDLEVYGGSLLVRQDLRGLAIGNHFIQSTLDEISKTQSVKIKSRKDNPANASYQRNGFEISGEHQETDGVEYYDMILPAQNAQLKAA
jgi:predicted GNAT family N-acyltransferase